MNININKPKANLLFKSKSRNSKGINNQLDEKYSNNNKIGISNNQYLTFKPSNIVQSKSSIFSRTGTKQGIGTEKIPIQSHRFYLKYNASVSNNNINTQKNRVLSSLPYSQIDKIIKKNLSADKAEIQKVKRKVNKLINDDTLTICDKFSESNDHFNYKFISHITGDHYYNKVLQNQRHMHFHPKDLGEEHNKCNMLIDMEKINHELLLPNQVLRARLTKAEIDLIRTDPEYFIRNKELSKKMIRRRKRLVDILNNEDKSCDSGEEEGKKRMKELEFELQLNSVQSDKTFKTIATKEERGNRKRNRFNWTKFEIKISNALNVLNSKVKQAHSMRDIHQSSNQNQLELALQKYITKSINKSAKHKATKISLNFNQKLPSMELREYLNYALSKRVNNEMKIYEKRQNYLLEKKNNDYIQQKKLNQIRENIIETNKSSKLK